MNRHSRKKFYAEVDAYLAFWAEVQKDRDNGSNWFPPLYEERLLSIVDRIKKYT